MCRKRLGEEPWGSRDTHRLTRGFPLEIHINESSDYLAHLARPNGLVAVPFRRKPSHCWPVRVLLPSSTACVHAALSSEQRDQRAS